MTPPETLTAGLDDGLPQGADEAGRSRPIARYCRARGGSDCPSTWRSSGHRSRNG